jgi:hypothetical protein
VTHRGTYCDRSTLKAALGIASTDTASDAELLRVLENISRAIDNLCRRWFYVRSEARYYTAREGCELHLDADLLSVTTLKTDQDDDRDYDDTWAVTDYDLEPANIWPKREIERTPLGGYYFPSNERGVQINGLWGYGDGESGTPYIDTTTTTSEALDTTETGVDVVSGAACAVGQTVLIDSEQMYITSISTNTLTVERGVNGTTAAAHDTGKTVYRYRYPGPVVEACLIWAAETWRLKDAPLGVAGGAEFGQVAVSPSTWRAVISKLDTYIDRSKSIA